MHSCKWTHVTKEQTNRYDFWTRAHIHRSHTYITCIPKRPISLENHWNGMVSRNEKRRKIHRECNEKASRCKCALFPSPSTRFRCTFYREFASVPEFEVFRMCVCWARFLCVCVRVGRYAARATDGASNHETTTPLTANASECDDCVRPLYRPSIELGDGVPSTFAISTQYAVVFSFRSSRIQNRIEVIIQICIAKLQQ